MRFLLEVLTELDSTDQQRFLRFVTGRAGLALQRTRRASRCSALAIRESVKLAGAAPVAH